MQAFTDVEAIAKNIKRYEEGVEEIDEEAAEKERLKKEKKDKEEATLDDDSFT